MAGASSAGGVLVTPAAKQLVASVIAADKAHARYLRGLAVVIESGAIDDPLHRVEALLSLITTARGLDASVARLEEML